MSHKEPPLVKEIITFAIESLVFQKRLLKGAHSIWDIKFFDIKYVIHTQNFPETITSYTDTKFCLRTKWMVPWDLKELRISVKSSYGRGNMLKLIFRYLISCTKVIWSVQERYTVQIFSGYLLQTRKNTPL